MRFLVTVIGTVVLIAVVAAWLPLAWGFVALACYLFVGFAAIHEWLTPMPLVNDEDED